DDARIQLTERFVRVEIAADWQNRNRLAKRDRIPGHRILAMIEKIGLEVGAFRPVLDSEHRTEIATGKAEHRSAYVGVEHELPVVRHVRDVRRNIVERRL